MGLVDVPVAAPSSACRLVLLACLSALTRACSSSARRASRARASDPTGSMERTALKRLRVSAISASTERACRSLAVTAANRRDLGSGIFLILLWQQPVGVEEQPDRRLKSDPGHVRRFLAPRDVVDRWRGLDVADYEVLAIGHAHAGPPQVRPVVQCLNGISVAVIHPEARLGGLLLEGDEPARVRVGLCLRGDAAAP